MVKVLIVDDSKTVCQILSREISKAPDMEVIGTAGDPYSARDKIVSLRPDVVTLDIGMPRMDGLTFLGKLMQYYPLPVIVVSSYTPKGTDTALHALELGALDVLEKPGPQHSVDDFGKTLVEKIRGAAQARRFRSKQRVQQSPLPPRRESVSFNSTYKILAVGASLGGTEAIRELLLGLPSNSPGILIVQHLPYPFTEQFANRLNSDCDLEVHVAKSGDLLSPGVAIVAPGDKHIVLCRRGLQYFVEIKNGPPVHCHRPSIDVFFHSVAACAGPAAIGILLTGMGADGARGLLAMRQSGARTFAQDEESCIVFGMPKVAIELGAVEKVVSLSQMSHEVIAVISQEQDQSTACTVLHKA
jgi:two-component system chemotaxis response regulator CheB